MARKKCKPQKLPRNNRDPPHCECPKFIKTEKLFEDNIRDIAKSLIVIMIVCGIHECKANCTRQVIINIFKHYDEVRHRPNCAEPPQKMCKRNVLCCLAKHCLMTLVEAQLTYYIIKYALKAFFSDTPQKCIKNPVMDLQIICEQEEAFRRAAKRTVKVYAECEGILLPLVHNYNSEIKTIYQKLFESIRNRAKPLKLPQCKKNCKDCETVVVPTVIKQACDQSKMEEENNAVPVTEEYPFANFRKCCKCNFPLDLCDCKINPKSGKLCMDCSQGPFFCEWYRMDKEYRVKAKDHVCPIDCESDTTLQSEDFCTCGLPQFSDCEIVESCSEGECDNESLEVNQVCEEESESDTEEIEAKMEGCCYCCHMPVCDQTINMEKARPPAKINRNINDIFVEFQVIPPAKNIKNVRLPPETQKKRKNRAKKEDADKNKQTDKDKDKDKDKLTDKEKDKNKDKEKQTLPKDAAIKYPIALVKTDKTGKEVDSKDTKKKDEKAPARDALSFKDKARKSGSLPIVKFGDQLGPASDRNDTKMKRVDNNTGINDKSTFGDGKDKKSKHSADGDADENGDKNKRRKSRSNAKSHRAGKFGGKKLPCCKCGIKKDIPKCKKCQRCRPVLKNRLVPAPILC